MSVFAANIASIGNLFRHTLRLLIQIQRLGLTRDHAPFMNSPSRMFQRCNLAMRTLQSSDRSDQQCKRSQNQHHERSQLNSEQTSPIPRGHPLYLKPHYSFALPRHAIYSTTDHVLPENYRIIKLYPSCRAPHRPAVISAVKQPFVGAKRGNAVA